ILKVGPALTFALREAIFALAQMENELISPEQRSRVLEVIDEVTVKRLKKQGNKVELLPENSEFTPIVVDLREQSFTIEGLA
ncbi:class II D-tagatose-bisphosphate aldolase, non-catalytic subunit, partial [Salmonella enterica subsp. enterica serovar Montevideo]|nr:class II D-tagatose-bisphosphate aldolase, non-catalytic subunit [Salmonella enterica subsp. enterica serovar Montevideo]